MPCLEGQLLLLLCVRARAHTSYSRRLSRSAQLIAIPKWNVYAPRSRMAPSFLASAGLDYLRRLP